MKNNHLTRNIVHDERNHSTWSFLYKAIFLGNGIFRRYRFGDKEKIQGKFKIKYLI